MILEKRIITPHKNGRTARIDMRATGGEKAKIIRYAKAKKLSIIDAFIELIDAEEKRNKQSDRVFFPKF
jgi:hypothetical protein